MAGQKSAAGSLAFTERLMIPASRIMRRNMAILNIPLSVGMQNGTNANMITDASGEPILVVYGVHQNISVEEARQRKGCAEGLAVADSVVRACNSEESMISALRHIASLSSGRTTPVETLINDTANSALIAVL
jgi:hypothetical protein